MVYGVSQYKLRQALELKKETLPNQKRKPTQRPSMQWVYTLFSGVQLLMICDKGQESTVVINLNEVLHQIIGYFGPRAHAIYYNTG
jgi:transposase